MQNLLRRSRILSHAKRGFFTRRSLQSSASIFDSSSRRQRRDRMLQDRQGNMSEEADATSILDKKPIGTEFFITCHPGFESVLAGELHGLGFSPLKMSKAGVSFWSERSADGIRACLWLRSAIRVLMLLSRQHLSTDVDHGIRSGDSVYEATRAAADWSGLIPSGMTFSIDSRVWSCADLTSSKLASIRIKDAICDSLRDARGEKPAPPGPGETADVPLYCSLYKDTFSIFRDMSGSSLHRRGYRDAMHRSPLNEAAAAAMLLLSDWKHRSSPEGLGDNAVLVDPMCGSGTLLFEAALIASNVAPGLMRPSKSWPFRKWPDLDNQGMFEAVQEARDLARPWRGVLYGNDVHKGALSLAMRDASSAKISDLVSLRHGDCRDWKLPKSPSLVITNPPWGMRLLSQGAEAHGGVTGGGYMEFASKNMQQRGRTTVEGSLKVHGNAATSQSSDDIQTAWRSLSDFLRSQCGDSTAYVISGNKAAVDFLRMRPSRKIPVTIGGVDCKIYEIKVLPPKVVATHD